MSDAWIPEGKIHDFRGKNFQDFAKIDFSKIGIDPARSIVLFDDHMDQLRRLQEAKASGFQHVMFDDNFIPGSGDIYSLKNVCDNTRKFRRYITTGAGADSKRKNRRCDMFHKTCLPLTASMIKENYKTLMEIVDVYYEFPPLGNDFCICEIFYVNEEKQLVSYILIPYHILLPQSQLVTQQHFNLCFNAYVI